MFTLHLYFISFDCVFSSSVLSVPDPPPTKRVAHRWRNPRLLDARPEEAVPVLRSVTPGWAVNRKRKNNSVTKRSSARRRPEVTKIGPRERERERERANESRANHFLFYEQKMKDNETSFGKNLQENLLKRIVPNFN